MLEQMIPDAEMRRQFQDFFDGNAGIREQFPGGLVDFARVAAEWPEEVMDEMMVAAAMANEAGGDGGEGRMPGEMPEDEREREGEWMQLQFVENEQPPIEDWEEREIQETMVRLNEGMAALLEEEETEARRQREAVAVDDEDEDEEEEDEDEEEEEAVVCVSDVLFFGYIL